MVDPKMKYYYYQQKPVMRFKELAWFLIALEAGVFIYLILERPDILIAGMPGR